MGNLVYISQHIKQCSGQTLRLIIIQPQLITPQSIFAWAGCSMDTPNAPRDFYHVTRKYKYGLPRTRTTTTTEVSIYPPLPNCTSTILSNSCSRTDHCQEDSRFFAYILATFTESTTTGSAGAEHRVQAPMQVSRSVCNNLITKIYNLHNNIYKIYVDKFYIKLYK